jgi:hypothetical protein
MNPIEVKKNFIRSWYRLEKSKHEFPQQIELAREWIKICVDNDEFEMASALSDEIQLMKNIQLGRVPKKRWCGDRFRYSYLNFLRKKRGR